MGPPRFRLSCSSSRLQYTCGDLTSKAMVTRQLKIQLSLNCHSWGSINAISRWPASIATFSPQFDEFFNLTSIWRKTFVEDCPESNHPVNSRLNRRYLLLYQSLCQSANSFWRRSTSGNWVQLLAITWILPPREPEDWILSSFYTVQTVFWYWNWQKNKSIWCSHHIDETGGVLISRHYVL